MLVDAERVSHANYRDMIALRLTENHEHLEKLIWDMQDALDNLVSEGQKQVDCLGEIEGLIGNAAQGKAEKEASPAQGKEDREEVRETRTMSRSTEREDKSTQCGEVIDDTYNIAALEERHCQYMLEVLSHLRYTLEILSPFDIDRPGLAKYLPETKQFRVRLKGTIRELNAKLVEIVIQPKSKGGHLIVARNKGISPVSPTRMSPLVSPKSLPQVKMMRSPGLMFPMSEPLVLNMHLRLKTLEPFTLHQTRPLPQSIHPATKAKYAEVEYIQALVPELSDSRFNITDLLHPEMNTDEFYMHTYFTANGKNVSAKEWEQVEEDVTSKLHLCKFMLRRRKYLKMLFLSYNMESMSTVKDMLSMEFVTFIKLLKDTMLLTPSFDLLTAAKVFYLSCIKSKSLPQSTDPENERKWFKHLLNSYHFKTNYRLFLPNFLECLVRLTYYHPRFSKMATLKPGERVELLYKRHLKPLARLTQGYFYASLLRDIHVNDVLVQHEVMLHEIFTGYTLKLTNTEKLLDFVGKDHKMDLHKYYSFLSNAGVLMEAEIVQIGNADIEEEINQITELKSGNEAGNSANQPIFRQNQANLAVLKETAIRFPSSMFEREENKLIKIKASRNTRLAGAREIVLLPFYRPVRSALAVDKLTAFSFFVTVMNSVDSLFTLSPKQLTDTDFCLDFREFVDVVGMLGILYWKSVIRCLDISLVEGLSTFLKIIIDKFRYMREFRGFSPDEKDKLSIGLIKLRLNTLQEVQRKPIITKTMLPQERFIQRRDSI